MKAFRCSFALASLFVVMSCADGAEETPAGGHEDGGAQAACGEGTVLDPESGECRVGPLGCAAGTRYEDGMCVADGASGCDDGTVLDPVSGECVLDASACADGTTLSGDTCIPDGTILCAQGTRLDEEAGECVIDESACAEGTVLADGECITEDEQLGEMADEEEGDEPNAGGAGDYAGEIEVPEIDGAVTLYGCIEPVDSDGNDELESDLDVFLVKADGPALIEVTVDGLGGLAAGFLVESVDPEHAPLLDSWRRFGVNLSGDTAKRQVYLPLAGEYALSLSDSRSLLFDVVAGGESACYFATVEHLPLPEAEDATLAVTFGQDEGDVRVLRYTAEADGDYVEARLSSVHESEAYRPAFVTLRNGELSWSSSFVSPTPPWSSIGALSEDDVVTYVIDAEINYALTPRDYRLDFIEIDAVALPTGGTQVTLNEAFGSSPAALYADFSYLYFDIDSPSLKRFDITASTPVRMWIVRGDVFNLRGELDIVAAFTDVALSTQRASVQGELVRFTKPGRYYLITVDATVADASYTVLSSVTDVPLAPLTYGAPAEARALQQGNGFHALDLEGAVWIELGLTATSDWNGSDVEIAAYDLSQDGWLQLGAVPVEPLPGQLFPVFSRTQPSTGPFAPLGRIVAGDATDYLVRVRAVAATGASPTYHLRAQDRAGVVVLDDVEPGSPAMHVASALDSTAPKSFIAFGGSGGMITAVADPALDVDVAIRRLNADETVAESYDAAGAGGSETLERALPAAPRNWLAFALENATAATPSDVSVTVSTIAATTYTVSSGLIPFADACAFGVVLGMDLDDDVLTARTLPAELSGFELFGLPLPAEHRVSANGWLSWDTAPVANGGYRNQALPAADAPNALIAPFWQDLQDVTLCRHDDAAAGTVTYQWMGNVFNAPEQAVLFQTILHDDGVIDFVYGPLHVASGGYRDTDGNGATVGLESPSGSHAEQVLYDEAGISPRTTRTFTPD